MCFVKFFPPLRHFGVALLEHDWLISLHSCAVSHRVVLVNLSLLLCYFLKKISSYLNNEISYCNIVLFLDVSAVVDEHYWIERGLQLFGNKKYESAIRRFSTAIVSSEKSLSI